MACGQPLQPVAPAMALAQAPQPAPAMPAPQPVAIAQAAHHVPIAHTPAPVPVAHSPQPPPVAHSPQPPPVAPHPSSLASGPSLPSHGDLTPSPGPVAPQPIFAQPVIDVGGAAVPEAPGQRVCGRCRGANLGSSLFCRYCGASLANAQMAPAPPVSAPALVPAAAAIPAPTPPPAVAYVPAQPPAPEPRNLKTVEESPSFDLPKASAELTSEAKPSPREPATDRDQSPRKGTWLNTKPRVARGQLVVITKEGTPGPSYPIYDQVDIGRAEGDVVLAEDRYLSPRHARMTFREDRLYLRDLDSVNGLFLRVSGLRGKKVSEIDRAAMPSGGAPSAVANVDSNVAMELQDQDLILIGQQVLRFEALRDGESGLGPASEHGTLLFGTPTAPRYARLSQRTVEGVTRDVYYIRKVETVLGRESGDVVFTDDPFLSRRHAAFLVLPIVESRAESRDGRASQPHEKSRNEARRKRATVHLVDLGSSNGTFLGLRGETEVRTGDLVRMGQQLFRIDIGGAHG